MAGTDPNARYSPLQAAGASSRDVYSQALKDGLPVIEALRVIRLIFGLSLEAAKTVDEEVRGPRPGSLTFATWEQLEDWLGQKLGYCGCDHYAEAIDLLRDVLRSVRDWEDALAVKDEPGMIQARRSMKGRLGYENNPGLATWFLYWLDHHDLIWHAGRASECGLMKKGRVLLEAIERLYPPPDPIEDEDARAVSPFEARGGGAWLSGSGE